MKKTARQTDFCPEGGVLMKYVLISLAESTKIDFSGSEKLGKTDHLILLYVKGKKTLSAKLKEQLEEIPAVIEYYEIGAASELWLNMAYLIGVHTASKHDVYVITEDKDMLPGKIAKEVKVYSAFRSIAGTSAKTTAKSTASSKKTTTSKSSASKSSSSSKKASSSKKTSASKSSTAKKTTKKTAAKKSNGLDVADILTKSLTSMAEQFLKNKK